MLKTLELKELSFPPPFSSHCEPFALAGHRISLPAVRAAPPDPPATALLPPSTDRGSAVSQRLCGFM